VSATRAVSQLDTREGGIFPREVDQAGKELFAITVNFK